ncbi:MAG: site-specific integrase [Bacteroidales bacterium]|nr:site-specific integrase [Bacteroidales bacterium]
MERTNLNILFFIRKNKIKKNGKLPIFLRLTVNGERAEFVLERDVLEEDWDTNTERAKGKSRQAKALNDYLDHVKMKIREIKIGLEEKKESVRLENIKNIFQGVKSTERTLLSIIEEHNVSFKELIGKDYTKGTYTKYMTLKKHIEGFIQHKYQKNDLVLSELNTELVRGFEHYLKTINNLQNNTALKYIKALKKIVRVALSNNWIDQDPFSGIKYHTDEVKIDFLTNDELEKIRKKDFHIDRVNQVRDVYVFCCYTGLAFIDVFNLQKTDIIKKNGKYWIEKERQKTKVLYIVPLLPPAMNIVRKYENHPLTIKKDRLLPVLSNQKMNCYLKEIADLCGIRKKLTTHTARHTFATTVTLGNQVSMEVVAKMLGHTNTKMTAKYARVLDTVISKDMEKVFAIY